MPPTDLPDGPSPPLDLLQPGLIARDATLRAIVDNTSDAIFVKDLAGRYLLMNPAGARLCGMAPADIVGKTDADIFDADTARHLRESDHVSIANPAARTFEESLIVAGERRYYSTTKYVYHDDDGRMAGLIGISRDITESKVLEQKILWANQRHALRSDVSAALARGGPMRTMLETSLAAFVRYLDVAFARIWTLNEAEQVLELQASSSGEGVPLTNGRKRIAVGELMVGYIAETGRPAMTNDVAHSERLRPIRDNLLEHGVVAFAGYPLTVEGRLLGVMAIFGKRALSASTLELLEDAAALIAQGLARKLLEEELKRQNEQLLALDQMKSVFVSSVSHELRTPLTAILGFSEFLEDELGGPLTASQADFVTHIQQNTRRLQRLVDDLLDFARLESGHFRLNRRPGELGAIVRAVASGMRPLLDARQLRLVLAIPPDEAPIEMDAARIEQVLVNLLGNAIKFTPEDGTIRVTVAPAPGHVRVSVQDTGMGVPPEVLPRLFDRFYQADASLTRTQGGTGLGLSIAKALIEAHGGRIGAESTPGAGSNFWFELPTAPGLGAEGNL
jgi:PAS domain S-box-containing protein